MEQRSLVKKLSDLSLVDRLSFSQVQESFFSFELWRCSPNWEVSDLLNFSFALQFMIWSIRSDWLIFYFAHSDTSGNPLAFRASVYPEMTIGKIKIPLTQLLDELILHSREALMQKVQQWNQEKVEL